MKKKVILSGYYGFNNFGDEAILYALVKGLQEDGGGLELLVLSENPLQTSTTYGVESSPRWPLHRVLAACKDCDLFVTGGGGLIQDKTSSRSIPYYLGLNYLARRLGAKTALFACGIGPVSRNWQRKVVVRSLAGMDFISVRDKMSSSYLQEWGLKIDVDIIPDPVFSLQPPGQEKGDEILAGEGIDGHKPRLMIAPRNMPGQKEDIRPWWEIINGLKREGFAIILWPLDRPADMNLCQEIARGTGGVNILEAHYSPPRLLALMRSVDLILGVRLHSLIMGAVAGTALVGVSYDPKVSSFLETFDLPRDLYLKGLDPQAVIRRVLAVKENLAEEGKRVEEKVISLRQKARQGFSRLKELL